MGAINTAKEIARIAVTSGLSKEVISLLEKKGIILAEQVSDLEKKVVLLEAKVSDLESEKVELQQQLDNLRPKENRLDDVSEKFLKLLFEHDELSLEQIASSLNISMGLAEYHNDLLTTNEMIRVAFVSLGIPVKGGYGPTTYRLTPKGREYVVKNSLHLS